jgi:hypothetical protein
MSIVIVDIEKYRALVHEKRREARAEEFAPLDIKATIPSEAAIAEAARQAIRDKYATLQAKIDAAQTIGELKNLMPG